MQVTFHSLGWGNSSPSLETKALSGTGFFTLSPVERFIDALLIAGVFGAGKPVHLGHPAGASAGLKSLEVAKEKLERVAWVGVLL